MLKVNFLASLLIIISACGYGFTSLKNPWEKQGIKTVYVPMFKNKTIEGGAEVPFTDSLRFYIESRSGKLKLVNSGGDAYIDGEVTSVTLTPGSIQFGTAATEAAGGLPNERLLAATYTVTIKVNLKMIRESDSKVLWTNSFSQAISMASGTYTDERSSSDVFIKETNKRQAIKDLADRMMTFAVDSLLEEF
jgi:hypothetical protein